MDEVKKLYDISKNILKIYQQLMELEKNNLIESKSYKDQIEILNLYKEVEETLYKKIQQKYNLDQILNIRHKINVDNIVEDQLDDFEFAMEHAIKKVNKETLVKRRVYNRISDIYIQLLDSDTLLEGCGAEIITPLKINIGDKDIFVGDRGHTINDIDNKVRSDILLKYLYFIQLTINENKDNSLLIHKYDLLFLNNYLENKVLQGDYNIPTDFLQHIHVEEPYIKNEELYQYCLEMYSDDLFYKNIDFILSSFDDSFEESRKNFILLEIYEALIAAVSLSLDEKQKNNMIFEIKSIINNENRNIRKIIVKAIEKTKKR